MARCRLWWFSVRLTTCNSLLTGKFSYGLEVNSESTDWNFFCDYWGKSYKTDFNADYKFTSINSVHN
jgi:hypothetical protein